MISCLQRIEKRKFVEDGKKAAQELQGRRHSPAVRAYLTGLLQSTKNRLKDETRFILGRKTLLKKILEGSDKTKSIADKLEATIAIILSNDDPFELYGKFKAER